MQRESMYACVYEYDQMASYDSSSLVLELEQSLKLARWFAAAKSVVIVQDYRAVPSHLTCRRLRFSVIRPTMTT